MTKVDPAKILEDLQSTATTRKRKTLDLIYSALKAHSESGNRDFSIATIGLLVSEAGGPSTQAIRNPGGLEYRRLIEAWAAAQGTTCKKPPSNSSRSKIPARDEDILKRIDDPALRAVVGTIIAERNKFKNELRVLKSQTELIIDRRPVKHSENKSIQPFSALEGVFNALERDALEHSISPSLLESRGWQAFDNGRVKDENNRHLYKPGYITAITKLLKESSGD